MIQFYAVFLNGTAQIPVVWQAYTLLALLAQCISFLGQLFTRRIYLFTYSIHINIYIFTYKKMTITKTFKHLHVIAVNVAAAAAAAARLTRL